AGGARHQRHGRLQLHPGRGPADARAALRQDRQRREPPGLPARLRDLELRREQGRAHRPHQVGRRGPRPFQHQRQRGGARIREDPAPHHAAGRGAGARRARVGARARRRPRGCRARHRVLVQRRGAPHHRAGDHRGWRAHARLKNPLPPPILGGVSKPLKNNYLVRGAWGVMALLMACGGKPPSESPVPAPTRPLPTAGIAGQPVSLLPLPLMVPEDSLHWTSQLGERRAALTKSDSVLGALLKAGAPEGSWVLPEDVRRAAHRAPGVVADPDQMATAVLRVESITQVPDPLRSQLRNLAAVAGSGGRFVVVPAALIYRRPPARSDPKGLPDGRARTIYPTSGAAAGAAELSIVLVDVRTGQVGWRTVARGEGDDPWTALARAVKSLTPGLPCRVRRPSSPVMASAPRSLR